MRIANAQKTARAGDLMSESSRPKSQSLHGGSSGSTVIRNVRRMRQIERIGTVEGRVSRMKFQHPPPISSKYAAPFNPC